MGILGSPPASPSRPTGPLHASVRVDGILSSYHVALAIRTQVDCIVATISSLETRLDMGGGTVECLGGTSPPSSEFSVDGVFASAALRCDVASSTAPHLV
jgi:hypothetical protein